MFKKILLLAAISVSFVIPHFADHVSAPDFSASAKQPLESLHIFYGSKIALSLLLAGTAMTDPEADILERAIAGGSALLLSIPSSAVWHYSRQGNSEAVSLWRRISFAADLSLAGSLTGFGAYLITTGDVSDQWTGLSAGLVGVLGMALSSMDLRPFQFEN